LRLGKSSRVHHGLKKYTEDHLIESKGLTATDDLNSLFKSKPVIATTCLGVNNHPATVNR
jgi:hypothetical protein